jgi:hypothetical protein
MAIQNPCPCKDINSFTFSENCHKKTDGSFAPTREAWLNIHIKIKVIIGGYCKTMNMLLD